MPTLHECLSDAQRDVLASMWRDGQSRARIAEALNQIRGGVSVKYGQITALAAEAGLGPHPRFTVAAEVIRHKTPVAKPEPAPVDPLLATEGRYAALDAWAKAQKPPLSARQALQRYHRARVGAA